MKRIMKLKETFSTIPKLYDKARLDYPAPLFRDILRYAKLKKNDPILEIGTGTGKATIPFAKTGHPLIANDLSRSLLKIAKRNLKWYKNVRYIVSTFENAQLPGNRFGLIFCAQAFHWVKPSVRFTKTLRLLRPGGTLALFWNYNYYDRGIGKMALAIHKKYSHAKGDRANVIIDDLKSNKHFTGTKLKIYRRAVRMSHQEYVTMQTSYSWYLSLSAVRKKQARADLFTMVKRLPDPLSLPIKTKLMMANKKIICRNTASVPSNIGI